MFCVWFRLYWKPIEITENIAMPSAVWVTVGPAIIQIAKERNQVRPVNNPVYRLYAHLSITNNFLPGEVRSWLHPTQKSKLCNEVAWLSPQPADTSQPLLGLTVPPPSICVRQKELSFLYNLLEWCHPCLELPLQFKIPWTHTETQCLSSGCCLLKSIWWSW